jgi:hypothetical protein
MAFTKVLGPGIHTLSNITSHNIHSSGIITAISFVGDGSGLTGVASTDNIVTGSAATFTGGVNINSDLDVDGHTNLDNVSISGVTTFSGGLTGTTANFSGDVTVGGVLTYEDVKNVDSVGLITARNGIDCNGDIDVDGHTELDHVNIAGVTTFSDNDIHFKNNGITSCRFDSNRGAFEFNHAGGLFWYKNGNLSNSSGATIFYSEFANQYKGLVIQAPWQGQNNAKNVTVMGSSNGRFNVQNNLNASETFSAYFQGGVHLGYYQSGTKLSTTTTGITVGTGVTIETNGQATYTGIVTATAFKLADGSAIGAGAGGTWSTYTAGIATTKSVGVNTSNLDDNDLVGVGNSFQGLYISNGMIIHDNTLNGNHYIGTSMNGLMAGPVNIEGTLTIDGNYVVV